MLRLALLLHTIISTTLMGTAIVIALLAGYDTLVPILAAAALGFVVAIPVSITVARALA